MQLEESAAEVIECVKTSALQVQLKESAAERWQVIEDAGEDAGEVIECVKTSGCIDSKLTGQ